MSAASDVASVERLIPAPADRIFALIADPARHREMDGSGTVRDAKDAPQEPLREGSTFGMHMKMGMPYSMVSTVIDYEENRRIAWQTRPPGVLGNLFGGRIWRYELEPTDAGTLVRESWDISEERFKALVRPARKRTIGNMTATLERIDQLVA
jgi:uncharacterized protein YndB with AHSA1/START domain